MSRYFIPVVLTFANGADGPYYLQNPLQHPCVLRNVTGAAQDAFGTDETVTITENADSTALGVMTFAGTIAAGDAGAWVENTTTGDHIIGADEVFCLTISNGSAVGQAFVTLELDDSCQET